MQKNITDVNYQFEGERFNRISESAKDLIKKMLVLRDERIDICQVLEHPYLMQELESIPETRLPNYDIDLDDVNFHMSNTMHDMRPRDEKIVLGAPPHVESEED